jgi:hypothetical protein
MRRFSSDSRRVYVFDRLSRRVRLDVPRNVAVEREFNTLMTTDGTKERWPEARLAEIDGAVVTCFNKIERQELLTREERWYVSFFTGFAETRGTGFRNSLQRRRSSGFVSESGHVDERIAEALSAASGVWLDPSTIEQIAREDTANIASGLDDIGGMVEAAFELAQHVFWMEWLVGFAPAGFLFLTGDRPLGLLSLGRGFGNDPLEPGVIKVLPVSPTTALFIGDLTETPSITHETVGKDMVRLTNVAVARRCDRYIVGSSEMVVRSAALDAKLDQP